MSHFFSKFFVKKIDENFLKEFSRNFYKKIVDTNDYNTFENILYEWIGNNTNENIKLIFELMENHEQNEFWFSSIIGFFYQFGISCDVDRNKALEFYLLAVNHGKKEFSDQNFIYLYSLEEDHDNEFDILQNINIITGKYLLSFFYYKDIILYERKLNELNLNSARQSDPIAQYNLGNRHYHGNGVTQDYKKALDLYLKSANNGNEWSQYSIAN